MDIHVVEAKCRHHLKTVDNILVVTSGFESDITTVKNEQKFMRTVKKFHCSLQVVALCMNLVSNWMQELKEFMTVNNKPQF